MDRLERPPAGPRGIIGAAAEDAAVEHLRASGWTILARNLRIGDDEIDIVALEPGRRPTLVVVEVRSRSGPRFGAAVESVDARKVARLYRAAMSLRRTGHPSVALARGRRTLWRVDLITLSRAAGRSWTVETHLRGLMPP